MDLYLKPKDAAPLLDMTVESLRRRIREGRIEHVIDNGGEGSGRQYRINMTREFGITREAWDEYTARTA